MGARNDLPLLLATKKPGNLPGYSK